MDYWKKFNKTTLPKKEEFYSNLNIEDIIDADYAHTKRVWKKKFWNKKFRWISWFYLKNDVLLLANVFKNLRKKNSEICELDPAKFISAPGLAWQAVLKKTEV